MKTQFTLLSLMLLTMFSCNLKSKTTMQDKETNPLLCDPETGVCEVPEDSAKGQSNADLSSKHRIKVIYYTDPICSSCWGIEPQLRKLKLEYGRHLDIEYRMGGLLPDWSYNSGGISKPSDVAHHWDEVSAIYDMPIDGDVWLEDPLPSSYPPSIAFKAAQMQNEKIAIDFLRRIREMVFLEKKNITKWEHLETAAKETGLDIKQLKSDYENEAIRLFNEDLALGKELGVRGFPSVFFIDSSNNRELVYGSRPYEVYEFVVQKLYPEAKKQEYDQTAAGLFQTFKTLTAKEFSILSNTNRNVSGALLESDVASGLLKSTATKNGNLYYR